MGSKALLKDFGLADRLVKEKARKATVAIHEGMHQYESEAGQGPDDERALTGRRVIDQVHDGLHQRRHQIGAWRYVGDAQHPTSGAAQPVLLVAKLYVAVQWVGHGEVLQRHQIGF